MVSISNIYKNFKSVLSLLPLVIILKKMIAEEKPGAKKLYEGLLNDIESQPQLLQPINDISVLKEHTNLVETLLSTIFPPSTTANEGYYAIASPFGTETIFASPEFIKQFLQEGTTKITLPDDKTNVDIARASLSLAFNLILHQFYSHPVSLMASSIYPLLNAETGLTTYYDLKLNAQFIDVKCIDTGFSIPTSFSPQRTLDIEELQELFPLESFQFEGIMVIEINDVTHQQVVNEIKNSLLDIDVFSDVSVYDKLQLHIQSLIGLNNVKIGVTPFFKINDCYLYADIHYKNSLLFRNDQVIANKDDISDLCQEMFKHTNQPLLYQSLTESNIGKNKLLKYYFEAGARSLIICPLKRDNGTLIGVLEIMCKHADRLRYFHLTKLQSALPLFTLALEKSSESLELQIDKTIKEHFTAVQPAVEWKFTEAAFNYLQHKQHSEVVKMHAITFQDVYPLYAAIDIRSSSTERNNAIQLDVLEQLNLARSVAERAGENIQFPLLQEIIFRLDNYISSATDTLVSDDEMTIYNFLQTDLHSLFIHLKETRPELKKIIDEYMHALDPYRKIVYHHRKAYEESITHINDILDRFVDQEQVQAQQIFPHYFERYVTDGIEFNIYIGQALAPRHKFDEMYVRNLKIWQLTLLAKAARLSYSLEKKLSLPLQTTQLILAHSIPLSISFRNKERKFDVDGAYNIRYEIIKKRIDKVHTKESGERLTQPGKIAIVYSQQKELNEYLEYISFLQSENLLIGDIEHLELEELQGISGLKAVRVDVNYNDETGVSKVELSNITSNQLLRK